MALLLGEIVRRQARWRPERTAYVIGPHRVSYARLNALANRFAHVLGYLGIGRGDRVATLAANRLEYPALYFAAAMFHMGGWAMPLGYWASGGSVVLMERADPGEILRLVAREGVTYLYLIPTLYRAVLDLPGFDSSDLGSLRALGSGTSVMTEEQVREIVTRFRNPNLFVMYGQTEAGPIATLRPADLLRKATSVGRPVPNVDVRLGATGAGDVGEITCRSEFTMLGYWRMPGATADTVRDGWVHTGDLGALDDEGFLHIAGRAREMIKSGGESVYPAEVERCLLEHPGIAEAAVFGVPDARWGEAVAAAVVARAGSSLDADAVAAFVGSRLAGYRKPRHVLVLDDLPRTASTRQVQKILLRERWTLAREAGR